VLLLDSRLSENRAEIFQVPGLKTYKEGTQPCAQKASGLNPQEEDYKGKPENQMGQRQGIWNVTVYWRQRTPRERRIKSGVNEEPSSS
jgi:hypothetical protein